jgi:hypothetical protein
VRESPPAAVLFELSGNRRLWSERRQELNEVGALANLQQHFANLIRAEDVFAMHFGKSQRAIGLDVRLELAEIDGNRYVIEEQESR